MGCEGIVAELMQHSYKKWKFYREVIYTDVVVKYLEWSIKNAYAK